MKKHVAAFIIIVLIVIGTFWFFPKSFFQQDEWAIFGNMIYTKLTNRNLLGVILPQSGLSHFTPFTRIVTRLTFDWFGLAIKFLKIQFCGYCTFCSAIICR